MLGNKIKGGQSAAPGALIVAQAAQLHPVVLPQVSHFKHVPLWTMVKLPHSGQASPM